MGERNETPDAERSADAAEEHDPDETMDGGPWAKTSSGDADSITEDEEE